MRRPNLIIGLVLVTTLVSKVSFAQTDATAVEYKQWAWNIGLTLNRYQWESDDENEIIGNNGMFQIGAGRTLDSWMVGGTVDIILGPYSDVRTERIKTDFFGTGLSLWTTYAFHSGGIRRSAGSYGFKFGVNYQDIVGRSVSNSDETNSAGETITDYTVRVASLSGTGGFYYAAMLPARLDGNIPELLITRIEGYMFDLSYAHPLQTTYSARYIAEGEDGSETREKERGRFRGFSVMATFSIFLGV